MRQLAKTLTTVMSIILLVETLSSATQINSTEANATEANSAQINATQINATQAESTFDSILNVVLNEMKKTQDKNLRKEKLAEFVQLLQSEIEKSDIDAESTSGFNQDASGNSNTHSESSAVTSSDTFSKSSLSSNKKLRLFQLSSITAPVVKLGCDQAFHQLSTICNEKDPSAQEIKDQKTNTLILQLICLEDKKEDKKSDSIENFCISAQ